MAMWQACVQANQPNLQEPGRATCRIFYSAVARACGRRLQTRHLRVANCCCFWACNGACNAVQLRIQCARPKNVSLLSSIEGREIFLSFKQMASNCSERASLRHTVMYTLSNVSLGFPRTSRQTCTAIRSFIPCVSTPRSWIRRPKLFFVRTRGSKC